MDFAICVNHTAVVEEFKAAGVTSTLFPNGVAVDDNMVCDVM